MGLMASPGPRRAITFRTAMLRGASRLSWLLVFLCIAPASLAQYRFDVWTADNGLPQNIVRNLCQTPDGYLWIATLDGLVRFDGVRFTILNKSNSPGINSNRFVSLFEDRNSDIWLSTEGGGVTRYNQGKFRTYTVDQGVPNNTVRAVTGDGKGNIWILATDTIAQWNEAAGRFLDITPRELKIRYDAFQWEKGGFWGADEKNLHVFIGGRFTTYPLPRGLEGHSLWGAALDYDGTIWLETLEGKQARIAPSGTGAVLSGPQSAITSYLDRRGHAWTIHIGYRLIRSIDYLSSDRAGTISIASLFEDAEQNLWLGSEGQGLYRLQKQSIKVYSTQQGLIGHNVYPILQDRSGAIWIGAWSLGLSRFFDGKFTNYTVRDGLPAVLVSALFEDRDGQLWVATHGGLTIYQNGRFRRPPGPTLADRTLVQAIYQDRKGTLWFGTSNGLIAYDNGLSRLITVKDGLAVNDVRVITESASGDLWIGGYGGLTRLRNGQFTGWTEHDGLPSNNVRAIYEDIDGVVWIGTYDGGLGRFKDGKFFRYDTHDGLFNNGVFQILEDGTGNFWMSCNRGIYRVKKQELNELAAGTRSSITSVAYGKIDGMLNVECNGGMAPAGIKTNDGKLWFPTQEGVAVVDPGAVSVNPQPPPVVIESLMVDRVPVPIDGPLRIPPRKENLEIQYTALSFIKSDQIRFKYMLEGLDSNWIDAGSRRMAYYTHVPPGTYRFRVIAENSDGVWNNEGKSLAITVLAPFYQTRWFETLILLACGLLILAAWRYRVAQLEREAALQQAFSRQLIASQEDERKRIAAELHDSLGQRLVVIKNLALFSLRPRKEATTDGSKTQTLEEISDEATAAINETREISYNLRPFQLDRLGLTKAIQALVRTVSAASEIRFAAEVDDIDDLFPEELRINFYRIVQEALSNVMKHSEATEVAVRVKRSSHVVTLAIEDNGRGFTPAVRVSPTTRNGFGLTGMAERARLLGGEFKVRSTPGRGTIMTVDIPLGGSGLG